MDKRFICQFCKKEHPNALYAYSCEMSHNPVYVPMTASEISNLVQFMYTKESSLISEELFARLSRYMRAAAVGKKK